MPLFSIQIRFGSGDNKVELKIEIKDIQKLAQEIWKITRPFFELIFILKCIFNQLELIDLSIISLILSTLTPLKYILLFL